MKTFNTVIYLQGPIVRLFYDDSKKYYFNIYSYSQYSYQSKFTNKVKYFLTFFCPIFKQVIHLNLYINFHLSPDLLKPTQCQLFHLGVKELS